MSDSNDRPTIDAMLHHINDAGWTYKLESLDGMQTDDRVVTVTHLAMVEDNRQRSATGVESSPAEALRLAIAGLWRIRGGA